MRATGPEFRDQVLERLLFDRRENDLTHDAIRLFHHRLRNAGEDLHLPVNTRHIGEQLPKDLRLRTLVKPLNQLHCHPRNVVGHLRATDVQKAPHQPIADEFRMLSHLCGGFVRRPPFQELEHLPRQA